jgi:hypothetical protein
VYIFVATGATCRKVCELLNNNPHIIFLKMTVPATFICMGAAEFKIGFFMVKTYRAPHIFIVATFAICPRIIYLTDKGLMYVFMAVNAFFPYLPETPGCVFFVTGEAGSGKMRTSQWKNTGIVLFNGE